MSSSVSNSGPNPISNSANQPTLPLTAINTASQLPFKLTATNYPSWRAQFTSLLIGYDLLGFVVVLYHPHLGLPLLPPQVLAYLHWYRQDKLLLNAIFSSVSENVMPLVAMADTSRDAWSTLARLFANRSRTRVMQLNESLTLSQRGVRSVSEFLQAIKATAEELALIETPLTNDDLTLHVLNGLGAEFRDIVAPIRARDSKSIT